MKKQKILFLCTGNSCRSQMAEGWTRHLQGRLFEAYFAGVEPHGIDPRVVRAMAEVGLDLSGYRSKDISKLEAVEFDYVITLCERAHEACPFFPARTRVMHAGFPDPPKLAAGSATEQEAMIHYRHVRDEIRVLVEKLPQVLNEQ